MLIWGVHVHVGVSSAHKVMPIITSLLNQYPHLLALSASSPYWDGEDTGYASNRAMMFQQLPTAGLPFQFQEWSEFERFVHDQKKTGIIDHINEIRWDIRPSPHLGTIEVRIFDGVSNLRELGALVALTHCLIVDLDRRLDAGEHAADHAAVARAGEQVARRAIRPGRGHHPRRRQQRAAGHRGSRRSAEPAGAGGAKSLGCADELAAVVDIHRLRGVLSAAAAGGRGDTTATCARSSTPSIGELEL